MGYKNRTANYPLYETTHFDNIRTMVENVKTKYPERIAMTYRKNPKDEFPSHLTFRECGDYVRDLATELTARGLENKKIAIIGESSPEWALAYFAALSMGAITVPIDKDFPASDTLSILNTAECEAVFFSAAIASKIKEIEPDAPSLSLFVRMGNSSKLNEADLPDGTVTIAALRADGKERVENGDSSYYDYEIDNERLASIVFTSGTTGKGKGVMLSQKNICSDMEQGMYNFQITYRTMCVLPLHHTFGSTVNLIGHFSQGCEICFSSGLRYLMKELKEYQPTHLVLVPLFVENFYKRITSEIEKQGKKEAFEKLAKVSGKMRKVGLDARRLMFRSVLENFGGKLEMIICGGAPLNPNIISFFDQIGVTILNGYGITECAPLISCNRNEYRKEGSVGLPIIGGKIRITDPNEDGEGEIAYLGPNVMLGYYKEEEATKLAIDHDGYFHTGDYGKIVMDGNDQWIYITGRLKNLIILSNGKNIYPEEIETDIQGIFGVNEVVVYAGESKQSHKKEVIVAEIFPDKDALESRGITDFQKYFDYEIRALNERNVSYKAIKMVRIREEEFPKNTSKKITRFAIDKNID